jgi:hypothetical protein
MSKEERVSLTSRELPLDSRGDVIFDSFEQLCGIFTEREIVLLVERQIRNANAANEANKKREARIREMERPVRAMAKELFPKKSWADLSPAEYQEAVSKAYPSSEKS